MAIQPQEDASHAHEYLTVPQAAKVLQVSKGTMYRHITKGRIPGAIRIGGSWRISAAVLAAAFQPLTLSAEATEAILQAIPTAVAR